MPRELFVRLDLTTDQLHLRLVLRLCDTRKQPPELDGSRELAALLIDGADRSLILLGDDEHRCSMGAAALAHKPRDRHSGAGVVELSGARRSAA